MMVEDGFSFYVFKNISLFLYIFHVFVEQKKLHLKILIFHWSKWPLFTFTTSGTAFLTLNLNQAI